MSPKQRYCTRPVRSTTTTGQPHLAGQRGIATILILLLTGLSLLAVILGLNSYLRANQEQGVTLQAQTQAQVKTWTGAEIVRLYLGQLLKNEESGQGPKLSDLTASSLSKVAGEHKSQASVQFEPPIDLQLTGIDGLSAHLVGIRQDAQDSDNNEYIIDVSSDTAAHTRAQATSTLRLVYRVVKEGQGSTKPAGNTVMDWRRDLQLSGGIAVKGQPGVPYNLLVDGNVLTGGNSITGVDGIDSTGSIFITSGSSFKNLHANGDVRITGSVSVRDEIAARGDVCVEGGASATGTVRANGSVIATGGSRLGDVYSGAQSDNRQHPALCANPPSSTYAQKLNFFDYAHGGQPFGVDLQDNASANGVQTKGSLRIGSGSIALPLLAQGDLVDTNWGGYEHGTIGGVLRIEGSNPEIAKWVSTREGLTVAVSPVAQLSSRKDLFNAYTLEANANYAFKIDANGYKVVDVRNISGMADGTYFLGDYDNTQETGWDRGYKDFLCKKLASNSSPNAPKCQAPVDKVAGTICEGYSLYNNCLSYNNGQWAFNGRSLAPGILWFQGNLDIGNGNYYNTLIATGSITTSGDAAVFAPNYAGYDGQHRQGNQSKAFAPTGICKNSYFPDKAPTNFCKDGAFVTTYANGIGNYALMAGSCTEGDCSRYTGGNIALGASNKIHGNVLAGNVFSSGGSTTVNGYITSLGLGNTSNNSQGGSTTVDISDLPPGFTPSSGSLNEPPQARSIQVRWSRYL